MKIKTIFKDFYFKLAVYQRGKRETIAVTIINFNLNIRKPYHFQ